MFGEIFDIEKISGWFYNIYFIVAANLLFLLSNLPLILFLIFVGIEQIGSCLPLFFLVLLPVIPALTAMFYSLLRLVQKRESNPLKDYVTGYRKNFKQAVLMGCIQLGFIFMIMTNLIYFTKKGSFFPLIVILALILLILIITTPSLYLILSKYRMDSFTAFKISIALTLGSPLITLGNTAAFLVMLMIYELLPVAVLFFLFSLYCILVIFMNRTIIREKNYIQKDPRQKNNDTKESKKAL